MMVNYISRINLQAISFYDCCLTTIIVFLRPKIKLYTNILQERRIIVKIIIVTTENQDLNETGFGLLKSCLSMKTVLEKIYNDVSIISCSNITDLENIVFQSPDIAVLAVKYIQLKDKKIWLSQYFEETNINYTGSTREVLEFDSNKILAKQLVLKSKIKTAIYMTVDSNNLNSKFNECFSYPQFVKPLDAANGKGIDADSLVYNFEDFKKKSLQLFKDYGDTIISEKYLSGREFTVAVLHNDATNTYKIAPMEIVPPLGKNNVRILGEIEKLADIEDIRPITNMEERDRLIEMATECFEAFGARDFGRIDFKMDESGELNFIEVNLVPGMTRNTSYFPNCFILDQNNTYSDVITLVVENAVYRANN